MIFNSYVVVRYTNILNRIFLFHFNEMHGNILQQKQHIVWAGITFAKQFFYRGQFFYFNAFFKHFHGKNSKTGHCAQNLMSFKMRVNKMGLKTDQFSRFNAYF
jgi:hypothetical protein